MLKLGGTSKMNPEREEQPFFTVVFVAEFQMMSLFQLLFLFFRYSLDFLEFSTILPPCELHLQACFHSSWSYQWPFLVAFDPLSPFL